MREAVHNLDTQDRVHEIPEREERLQTIAREGPSGAAGFASAALGAGMRR